MKKERETCQELETLSRATIVAAVAAIETGAASGDVETR
jgi:hypothetical protein